MTKEQIVCEYKQAKAPMKQIGILADENCCTKQEIVSVLAEAGVELPGQYTRYSRAPKAEIAASSDPHKPTEQREPVCVKESGDVVLRAESLYLMLRLPAVDAIRDALAASDKLTGDELFALTTFREQVRGILRMLDYTERQCAGDS